MIHTQLPIHFLFQSTHWSDARLYKRTPSCTYLLWVPGLLWLKSKVKLTRSCDMEGTHIIFSAFCCKTLVKHTPFSYICNLHFSNKHKAAYVNRSVHVYTKSMRSKQIIWGIPDTEYIVYIVIFKYRLLSGLLCT